MARHNRDARGTDQRDFEYTVSYQPDWLRQVKVTRLLPSGRQSTMTLFTNPEPPKREPGRAVRTEIRSEEQGLAFQVSVRDPERVVKRVIVETGPPDSVAGQMGDEDVLFTIDHRV
jgi:hypothetical protein